MPVIAASGERAVTVQRAYSGFAPESWTVPSGRRVTAGAACIDASEMPKASVGSTMI